MGQEPKMVVAAAATGWATNLAVVLRTRAGGVEEARNSAHRRGVGQPASTVETLKRRRGGIERGGRLGQEGRGSEGTKINARS
jgi:hypothetical protein